jgi:hypothetical protein
MMPLPNSAHADGVWRPEAGAGLLVGGLLLAVPVIVGLLALWRFLSSAGAPRVGWFLLGCAALFGAGVVGLHVARLRSLRYILSAEALLIHCRGRQIAIPYRSIDDVILRPRDRIDVVGYERYWPGYFDAEISTSEGAWRSVATTPAHRRVRVQVNQGPTFAISPERPVLFVEALENRRRFAREARGVERDPPAPTLPPLDMPAPIQPGPAAVRPQRTAGRPPLLSRDSLPDWIGPPRAWLLFRERIVRGDSVASNLLALSVIALILLVTLTLWRADAVNTPVPIRWNTDGEAVQHVRPDGFWIIEGVWIFPATAGAVVAVNAALATFAVYLERLREARMLLAVTLPVELILMLALWRSTS